MVLDAIISLIHSLLTSAFSLLPTASLGLWTNTVSSWFANAGAAASSWHGLFGFVGDACTTLATVLNIVLPAVLTYKVANWIYKHIPQIGGFGPGSG